MSQNIALTLTLGGTQKAISNVTQLEEAIRQAKLELKQVEIGSAAFTKLASDVKIAEGRLKDFNNQTKGQDLAGRINEVARLGSTVAASFATASSAIQLFGGESEQSLAAVAKAQNSLTFALGLASLAQRDLDGNLAIANDLKKLGIALTNGLTAASTRLFNIIKTNPYTAILVAISALIAVMFTLNEETQEVTKSFDDLADAQQKAIRGTIGETQKMKELSKVVNDSQQPLARRVEAYKELQKIVPTLAGFTLKQATNEGLLNSEIQNQIVLIEERARARAIENKVTELYQKQFDLIIDAQKELNTLGGKASAFEAQIALQRENQVDVLGELSIQFRENRKQVDFLTGANSSYSNSISTVLDIQANQAKILADLKTRNEALAKVEAERLRLARLKIDLEVQEQTLANQLAVIQINALTTAQGFTDEETKILPILKQRLETQKALLAVNEKRLTQDEKILKFSAENEGILDASFAVFVKYTKSTEGYIKQVREGNPDLEEMQGILTGMGVSAAIASKELAEFVTPEGLANFDNYVQNQTILARSLFDIAKISNEAKDSFAGYLDVTEDLNDANLTFEERSKKLVELEEKRRTFAELFVRQYTGFSKKQIDGTEQLSEKQQEQLKGARELANVYLTNLPKIIDEIGLFEEGVTDANVEANKLNDTLRKGFPEALKIFFKENAKEFFANFMNLVQEIQVGLGAIQQTSQMFFNAQFDLLEKRNNRLKDAIIGDSEESQKKRIEAEKIYQTEREKLEKRAAKTQLRISLAQSLANTAEAISRAFAQTGIGGIISGSIVAAASGAQSIIIAQQLAAIDTYQKGGIMKKQGGGFVSGPSHEFGGVKFQGGGVELEGNEAIINRVSTINYMGLLDQINQAGGGRPISSIANESRLLEAIAKQRNTPIRAFVVESDITAKQETARRLERLSQF